MKKFAPYLVDVSDNSEFPLMNQIVFGRGEECDFAFPHERYMSRQHFMIEIFGHKVDLVDLGSSNDSRVNGKIVEDNVTLQDNDLIEIGQLKFKFSSTGGSLSESEATGIYYTRPGGNEEEPATDGTVPDEINEEKPAPMASLRFRLIWQKMLAIPVFLASITLMIFNHHHLVVKLHGQYVALALMALASMLTFREVKCPTCKEPIKLWRAKCMGCNKGAD